MCLYSNKKQHVMYENSLYNLLYLGVVVNIELDSSSTHKDPDVKLIDKIEEYQVCYILYINTLQLY